MGSVAVGVALCLRHAHSTPASPAFTARMRGALSAVCG